MLFGVFSGTAHSATLTLQSCGSAAEDGFGNTGVAVSNSDMVYVSGGVTTTLPNDRSSGYGIFFAYTVPEVTSSFALKSLGNDGFCIYAMWYNGASVDIGGYRWLDTDCGASHANAPCVSWRWGFQPCDESLVVDTGTLRVNDPCVQLAMRTCDPSFENAHSDHIFYYAADGSSTTEVLDNPSDNDRIAGSWDYYRVVRASYFVISAQVISALSCPGL